MRNFATFSLLGALVGSSLIACGDDPYDDGHAIDANAPRVHITAPERGTFAGEVGSIEVRGTATDDVAVTSVLVNGVTANVDPDGTFTATVPVSAGTNLLHAIAKDAQGNTGKETRAVVAGPMQSIDRGVPRAIFATMSAQTFDAIGRGASNFISTADLTAIVTPANPVVDASTTNSQPDCNYGQAFVTRVDIGASDIKLIPQPGGLYLDATLENVRVDMHLQWSALCFDGLREVSATASRVRVRGLFGVGLDFFGGIRFELQNPVAELVNFNVELGGVPQKIIDLLDLDTRLGPLLAWATERFVTPMLDKSLAGLNETKTVDVLGKPIDVTVFPTRVEFDVTGALIELDSELRARGDTGQFVYVPNTVPATDKSHDFELAIADDAANQLLTSFWSAKGMEMGLDLETGSYGEIGKLYDRVELSAGVPPHVDASGDRGDRLRLTIGDMILTFKNAGSVATQVVVNAQLELEVIADPETGALRFDVGTPTTYIDILDENIDGANALSNAQFEAITSFALSRIVAFGAGAIGAIPLPTAGGVSVRNASVTQQAGYLVVDGELR